MFFKKKNIKHVAIKRFMEATMKVNFDFESYSNHNIFNKLSSNSQYGFYYSPYGYFFRHPRWGKINELGFRQEFGSHEAIKKFPNHKFIALFGGSNGFSILVDDDNTFAKKLEKKLNNNVDLIRKTGKNFKILNFSQPANTMLNQIINYIIYGSQVKPDLVISHGGLCDFHYGQISDSFLLNNYDMTYVEISETWSKLIHDSNTKISQDFCDENLDNFKPVEIKNNPLKIIDSYHKRMLQFKNIVEANDSIFINSLEPFLYSKRSFSNSEKNIINTYNKYYQNVYNNMLKLFNDYQEKYLLNKDIDYNVNLHNIFKLLDSEETHFGDIIHTIQTGEEIIAENYYQKILKKYLDYQQ